MVPNSTINIHREKSVAVSSDCENITRCSHLIHLETLYRLKVTKIELTLINSSSGLG